MKSVDKLSETQKLTILTKIANEMLQSKKDGFSVIKPFNTPHTFSHRYRDLMFEAQNYAFPYYIKHKTIKEIKPVVSRGRNGKFEKVEIIYE